MLAEGTVPMYYQGVKYNIPVVGAAARWVLPLVGSADVPCLLSSAPCKPAPSRLCRAPPPQAIWLPERYPLAAPMAYVVPTPDMVIKPRHSFVDASGAPWGCLLWMLEQEGIEGVARVGWRLPVGLRLTSSLSLPSQAWCTLPTLGSGSTPPPTCGRWPR